MKLAGASGQIEQYLYDASGSIVSGTTPQLILGRSLARSIFIFANTSANPMTLEFGSARATCAITNGAVTSVTITNAGFNFTKPPIVRFWGGGDSFGGGNAQMRSGNALNTSYLGLNQPNGLAPQNPAKGHAVISGGSVTNIVIDSPGSGYVIAPYVFIRNSDLDPYGCAAPSATVGILIPSGSAPFQINGTVCPTDAISVFCATAASTFSAKWSD